jgi:peptidoglycan hydrolase CwlO-like protein
MRVAEFILLLSVVAAFLVIVGYGMYTTTILDALAEQTFKQLEQTSRNLDNLSSEMQKALDMLDKQIEIKQSNK